MCQIVFFLVQPGETFVTEFKIAAAFNFLCTVCIYVSKASLCAEIHTFTLHDVSGAIKVSGCVSRAGNAVVLPKLSLIRARRTADAAVCAGVVVMSWRALDCKHRCCMLVDEMLPMFTVGLNVFACLVWVFLLIM